MVQLWTDGSFYRENKQETKCGIGILIRRLAPPNDKHQTIHEHTFSLGLNKIQDNNLAELYAIAYGLYKLSQIKLHPLDKKLVVITDSQTAINFINGDYTSSKESYKEVVGNIRTQLKKYNYKLYWKKGHADCERQNLCDKLAKQGRLGGRSDY